MTQPLLSASSLSFKRASRTLLNDINLSIKPGELVGIIGPNGAGKSTLLKCLVGIHALNNGSITVQGNPLTQLSHSQRAAHISYLAQQQQAAFAFTVEHTICLGAYHWQHLTHGSGQTVQERLQAIVEQLDLQPLLHRKLDELSGGETQLVHFARILMQNTPLMLLDEPTAALDIGHETQLMNLLRHHCRLGSAALVAIHNLNIAAAFCDRLILLDRGEVLASGRAEDVITQARMNQLYAEQVMVSHNPVSGTVTVLPLLERQLHHNFTVHLIGGAGSTVALVRTLLQMGVKVTAGIGHEQDSDTEFWQVTGIEHIKVAAFSAITSQDVARAEHLVHHADITLLTEFPVGTMNDENLKLAAQAKNLWIIEEEHTDPSRFHHPTAMHTYEGLKASAPRYSSLAALATIRSMLTNLTDTNTR